MNRREFIVAGLGVVGAASGVQAAKAGGTFEEYRPGLIQSKLDAGKTVLVDYAATWCGTCRRQHRVISRLVDENPQYARAMDFVRVDWDTYRSDPVTTSRNIPRRSTLLVLRGNRELGRIVAGTAENQIRELMDLGLTQS